MNIDDQIEAYQFCRPLWCRIGGITFPDKQTVMLHLPDGECTDMTGAIAYAKLVSRDLDDFSLQVVRTVSGDYSDTTYLLEGEDHWIAVR